tara:strand:- start:207 stop:569 length:363 start_codon:yes stop_codon:yes gene_type:complete
MRNRMQTTSGNKSVLGSNAYAITQLHKKEKYMNHLLPSFNKEWLESKFKFSFGGGSSAPAPVKPEKSEAEVKAEANQERTLRAEESAVKKQQNAGKRRRRGRSLLISKGNTEKGLSDTLG